MVVRKCVVPSCLYRNRKNEGERRSMFQCPKDENKARLWAESIPGLEYLGSNQSVCEKHFEAKFIRRYFEKNSNVSRCRLVGEAVPTIFCETNTNDHEVSNLFSNNSIINNEVPNFHNNDISYSQLTSAFLGNNISNHTHPTSAETSLQEIVKDLSASEQLLLNIKQEMLSVPEEGTSRIKLENSEDYIGKVKTETNLEMKELTIYEQLQHNFNQYASKLPESWSISQLPIGNDKVFAFSKECTVSENEALMTMYEKNIVINKSGNLHYSIHGKILNSNHPHTPSVLNDAESLIDIILKFNDVKVCQGICTNEFEVDKDCIIYKDDLGYCRHVDCCMITDTQQCDSCYQYSQYLLQIVVNNTPVLSNGPVYFFDQIY